MQQCDLPVILPNISCWLQFTEQVLVFSFSLAQIQIKFATFTDLTG